VEPTHRRGGLVFCASPSASCDGADVHGHEQCYGDGNGRAKEDA
jgi:hypothetical protein